MTDDNVWLAYQLNRPGQGDGIIIAFRRKDSPDGSITVKLHELDQSASYELMDDDSGLKVIKAGNEITAGFTLTLPVKPSSLLIRYRKEQ